MPLTIQKIEMFADASGALLPSGVWTNDCSPFFRIAEPSGTSFLKGYSISIIDPGGDEEEEPDYNEITDDPGGAWLVGGEVFTWDYIEEAGWENGRWNDGSIRRNWWDISTNGLPPQGIIFP